MEANKVFSVKRYGDKWWAVLDCGESKPNGFGSNPMWRNHFNKDGRTYRWYNPIFMPPDNLIDWAEIEVVERTCTMVNTEDNRVAFEGFKDGEDLTYIPLRNFAALLGHDLTIEQVKDLIYADTYN